MKKVNDPALRGIVRGDFAKPLSSNLETIVEGLFQSSKILALGESFHTSDGFYTAKIRIFQHLIEKHSLKAIAFENPWSEAKVINAYVMGENVTLEEAVAKLFNTWRSKSIVAFLKWLREFNSKVALDQRVFFFGIDIQKPRNCMSVIRKFCQNRKAPEFDIFDSSDGSMILRESETDDFLDILSVEKLFKEHGLEKIRNDLDTLIRGLEKVELMRAEFSAHDLDLQICVTCLAAYFKYIFEMSEGPYLPEDKSQSSEPSWKRAFETRDKGMFDVFELIYRSLGQPKVVLWAHNLHIVIAGEVAPVWGIRSFGSHFAASYGSSYAPIALTAGDFQINWPWLPQMKDFTPLPPDEGSVERTLKSAVGPCYVELETSDIFPPKAGIYQFHPVEDLKNHFRAVIYLDHSPAMEIFELSL